MFYKCTKCGRTSFEEDLPTIVFDREEGGLTIYDYTCCGQEMDEAYECEICGELITFDESVGFMRSCCKECFDELVDFEFVIKLDEDKKTPFLCQDIVIADSFLSEFFSNEEAYDILMNEMKRRIGNGDRKTISMLNTIIKTSDYDYADAAVEEYGVSK